MKYIILILFLLTGVSLSACELESVNHCSTQEGTVVEENHASSDECCDGYCICNCCTKIPVMNDNSNFTNLLFYSNRFQININQKLTTIFYDHWQPPKRI